MAQLQEYWLLINKWPAKEISIKIQPKNSPNQYVQTPNEYKKREKMGITPIFLKM